MLELASFLLNQKANTEDTKILEFNQYHKSDKTFTIDADLEYLIEKINRCKKILKIHLHQKQVNKFHQIFQSVQYCNLTA